MKFNHSLQLNIVPEWASFYLDYAGLKRLIYRLAKEHVAEVYGSRQSVEGLEEQDALMSRSLESLHQHGGPDAVFSRALDKELVKIESFYRTTETKLFEQLEVLLADEADFNKHAVVNATFAVPYRDGNDGEDDDDDDEEEEEEEGPPLHPVNSNSSSSGPGYARFGGDKYDLVADYRITLKKRVISLYVSLAELQSFEQLNKTGFTKGLKKFRKELHSTLARDSLSYASSYMFAPATEAHLKSRIHELVELYARLATDGNTSLAKQALKVHLREHVVWERNTVWRDMMNLQRRTHGAQAPTRTDSSEDSPYATGADPLTIGSIFFHPQTIKLALISVVFALLVAFPTFESIEQSHCFAVVISASLLWATEALPLFVTSLLVPLLIVVLRIPIDEASGVRMTAEDASKYIFSQMWSSTITLLLGGFTLAAALSKFDIARSLATVMLHRSGTNPRVVLLSMMFLATFLSMWISNVAAPVLCYSVAQPLLRTLPEGSSFAKTVVFGIALASNIGGMVSPIASPQNVIALENMNPTPSWGQWFVVAIPVSLVSLVLIWGLLVLTFPIEPETAAVIAHTSRMVKMQFSGQQWYIMVVTIATIVLWVFSHTLDGIFGEMGVIALIPIVLFFGPGLLTSEDFNNFLWTIIALAMGGMAMGKAVSSSGLLMTVAYSIEAQIGGLSLYGVLLVFGVMTLILATFVSHTVAALIILPLVASVGADLPSPQPNILVMVCGLMCSAAMGLPTSGFPNVTAICMTDNLGKPYLSVSTFISRGILAGFLAFGVIVTIGYGLMVVGSI